MRTHSSVVLRLLSALLLVLGCEDGLVPFADGGNIPGPDPGAPGLGGRGGAIPGVDPLPRLIEVIATEYRFSPSELRAEPGEQLIVSIRNEGALAHGIEFELAGQVHALEGMLAPGETGRIRLVMPVDPGTYPFRCPSGEEHAAMRGDLLVLRPPAVRVETVASGLTSPTDLLAPAGGDALGRRVVVDQVGLVHVLTQGDELLPSPFLDLRGRIVALDPVHDERGLVGFAFHPEFAANGRLFAAYSAPLRKDGPAGWDHTLYVSEFAVSASDAWHVDPASERVILALDQPEPDRSGGKLAFGPEDGMLYVALGDGGGRGVHGRGRTPELAHAQDTGSWFGTVLRIDVDGGGEAASPASSGGPAFVAPSDNPLVGVRGADEIFAYGFRNPTGLAFDPGGELGLLVPDAGGTLFEEINRVEPLGNYGWNLREGRRCLPSDGSAQPPANCAATGRSGEPLLPPVVELPAAAQEGATFGPLVGGHVYRGAALPELYGRYVFGTFGRSALEPGALLLAASAADPSAPLDPWQVERIAPEGEGKYSVAPFLKGIGEDELGELYLLVADVPGPTGSSGRVLRLVASTDP